MAELTTNTNTDLNLWELLKSSESGGGGGGGSTSSFDIAAGINASADINTIMAKLEVLASQIPLNQSDIVAAINSSVDVDTLIAGINTIRDRVPTFGIADTVSQSTIIARLTAIEAKLQSGYRAAATIQRAADVNPYFANDVYGAPFELTNAGSSGGFIILNGVRIILNISTLPAAMSGFVLYLYSISPPSNVADNGAFSVPAGDRGVAATPILLTPLGIDMGTAQLAVGGGSVVLATTNINEEFKLATGSTSLFGYLVTRAAFTPAAPSETATIALLSFGV